MKSLKLILTAVVLISVLAFSAYAATVEVSNGDFSAAYAIFENNSKEAHIIILKAPATYSAPSVPLDDLTIKSEDGEKYALTLGSETQSNSNLKIDNVVLSGASTIYANGFSLEIGSGVTSTADLVVYGGSKDKVVSGTDVKLYGGSYGNVYGGGNGKAVDGVVNLVFGGNANKGKTKSNANYVYGGCNNARVTKSVNVTLEGNAVAKFLIAAGAAANGFAPETNVYIKGGTLMNAYGGTDGKAFSDTMNTNIVMTGGKVEALFGGCNSVTMNGNASVTVLGGTVERRIYSGCYNNASGTLSYSFDTDHYVKGTTTLVLGSGLSLITGSDSNRGIFAGSRTAGRHEDEVNTIVYLNGSDYSSKVGEQGLLGSSTFKSFENYIVKAGTGGTIVSANEAGKIKVVPDFDKYATINSTNYLKEVVAINKGTTTVTFAKNYENVTATAVQSGDAINVTLGGTLNASSVGDDRFKQTIIVSLYDSTGRYVGTAKKTGDVYVYPHNENCVALVSDMTYTVKFRAIAGFANAFSPLATPAETTVTFN